MRYGTTIGMLYLAWIAYGAICISLLKTSFCSHPSKRKPSSYLMFILTSYMPRIQ